MINHYKTLSVHRQMDADEIRLAYSRLARMNHPDRHPGDEAKANFMAELNIAYGVLGSRSGRIAYDKELDLIYEKCLGCDGKGAKVRQKSFTKREYAFCQRCHGAGVV